jgi:hypothetical protein
MSRPSRSTSKAGRYTSAITCQRWFIGAPCRQDPTDTPSVSTFENRTGFARIVAPGTARRRQPRRYGKLNRTWTQSTYGDQRTRIR